MVRQKYFFGFGTPQSRRQGSGEADIATTRIASFPASERWRTGPEALVDSIANAATHCRRRGKGEGCQYCQVFAGKVRGVARRLAFVGGACQAGQEILLYDVLPAHFLGEFVA